MGDASALTFLLPLTVLNFMWLFGIPAPVGSQLVRTEYPLYAFGTLMLVPLMTILIDEQNRIFLGCFLLLCIDPTIFHFVILFDEQIRIIFATASIIASFYFFQSLTSRLQTGDSPPTAVIPILIGSAGVAYWLMFNVYHITEPNIGVIIIGSISMLLWGLYRFGSADLHSFYLFSVGSVFGLFSSQVIQLSSGNRLGYSLYAVAIFVGYIANGAIWYEKRNDSVNVDWETVAFMTFLVSAILHIIEPSYITSLLGAGPPDAPYPYP